MEYDEIQQEMSPTSDLSLSEVHVLVRYVVTMIVGSSDWNLIGQMIDCALGTMPCALISTLLASVRDLGIIVLHSIHGYR